MAVPVAVDVAVAVAVSVRVAGAAVAVAETVPEAAADADGRDDALAVPVADALAVVLRVTTGVALAVEETVELPETDAVGVDDHDCETVGDPVVAADAESDGVSETPLLMRLTVKKAPAAWSVESEVKTKRSAVALAFDVYMVGSV